MPNTTNFFQTSENRVTPCKRKFERGADLSGEQFGKVFVIARSTKKVSRAVVYFCHCDCGNFCTKTASNLRSGMSASCGCERTRLLKSRTTTHGMTGSPERGSWKGIKARCFNEKCRQFKNYGGRGISMHSEWKDDFLAFFRDVGAKPGPEYSIERIDNEIGYFPGNVKWATRTEQNRNTRRNHFVYFRGEKMTLSQVSMIIGISSQLIGYRLKIGQQIEDVAEISGHDNASNKQCETPFLTD